MIDLSIEPKDIARSMKLRYVSSSTQGYTRVKKGESFTYLDKTGNKITDQDILDHIKSLVIPPAWTEVWICPYKNGHLQATGIDALGRKQYLYHPKWSKVRNDKKFDRILEFGQKLPILRKQISKDLKRKKMDRAKVVAIALSVMNETFIRSGNSSYAKKYGSYGLTTLKNKHVSITGSKAFFKFKGKKGIKHEITLTDKSLARLLKNVKELPGQSVFQYKDEEGTIQTLDSGDINEYLKEHLHEEFSSKDFRTWAGCVLTLQLMAVAEDFDCQAECKKRILSIIDGVAQRLGNTRAVSRKYYIHPSLITAFEKRKLDDVLKPLKKPTLSKEDNIKAEKALLKFLKRIGKGKG